MKRLTALLLIILFTVPAIQAQELMTLDDAIQIALENNSQLKNSISQHGVAKANRLSAYQGVLPRISFSTSPSRSYTSSRDFGPTGNFNPDGTAEYTEFENPTSSRYRSNLGATLSVNQTLWDNGRMWNQVRQGNAVVSGAEFGVQNSVVNTVLTVKERYYNLLKVIEQKQVLEDAVRTAEEQLKNSESMYEIGTVAQVDVFRSKVNLGNNKIMLLNHSLRIEDSKNQLNVALGRNVGTDFRVNMPVSIEIDYDNNYETLVQQGLSSHPQLRQLEENIFSSEMGLKVSKSTRYPTISVYGQYDRSNQFRERVFRNFEFNYTTFLSFNLNFNLFDGFATKSNINRSKNQLYIAEENYKDAERQIQSGIRNYHLQLKQYEEQITIRREILEAAEEELRLENERYIVGSGTLIETIQAQGALTSARFGLVESQFDALTAEARLHAAVGKIDAKYKVKK